MVLHHAHEIFFCLLGHSIIKLNLNCLLLPLIILCFDLLHYLFRRLLTIVTDWFCFFVAGFFVKLACLHCLAAAFCFDGLGEFLLRLYLFLDSQQIFVLRPHPLLQLFLVSFYVLLWQDQFLSLILG